VTGDGGKMAARALAIALIATLFLFVVAAACVIPKSSSSSGDGAKDHPPGSAAAVGSSASPGSNAVDMASAIDAERIVDRYIEELGGAGAAQNVHSIGATGTFEMPERRVTGSLELYAKEPNKAAVIVKTPDRSVFVIQAFDGAVGWEQSLAQDRSRLNLRRMTGAELDYLRFNSDFYWEFRLKELYPVLALKGKEKVDDREAYVVEAKTRSGNGETLYFAADSGLLVRRDMRQPGPTGETSVQIYFDNYQNPKGVSGFRLPFTRSYIYPDRMNNIIFRLSDVTANMPLKDSTFSMPG